MKRLGKLRKAALRAKSHDTVGKINKMLCAEARRELPYTPKPGHRPSKLAHKCMRMIYYSYFRLPEDTPADARLMKYRYAGNAIEEVVIGWLKEIGEHIPYLNKTDGEIPKDWTGKPNPQFKVKSPKWRINSGYIDNVSYKGEDLWLYEIKTAGKSSFEGLQEPKPEHFIQGASYVQLFNDLFLVGEYDHIPEIKSKAKGVIFLYVNRDNYDVKQFVYTIEQITQLILDIDKKVHIANNYVDTLELPPKSTGNCYFCPYQMKCEENWNSIEKHVDKESQ